jgi:DNA-binding response OmpR family regulator
MFSSVLIVEPDPDLSAFFVSHLAGRTAILAYTDNGRDALFRMLSDPPELLVTEARLPYLNGFDLCTMLRHAGHACLSILATPRGDAILEARSRSAGADIVLGEPLDARAFTLALDRLYVRSAIARAQAQRLLTEARAVQQTARILHAESRDLWRKLRS